MADATTAKPHTFTMETPYLSEGRTDHKIAETDQLVLRMKVYAEGGENSLHAHKTEDHAFVVLEGQATFYDHVDEPTVVRPYEGIMMPRGYYYRFESTGDRNLVILRVGRARPGDDHDRIALDGSILPGNSAENKRRDGVPIPGQFFGRANT